MPSYVNRTKRFPSSTISTTDRTAVFYVIPVNSPENYLRMGVFRVTGLKAYSDAPWW